MSSTQKYDIKIVIYKRALFVTTCVKRVSVFVFSVNSKMKFDRFD